jgi:hypothetical protein
MSWEVGVKTIEGKKKKEEKERGKGGGKKGMMKE